MADGIGKGLAQLSSDISEAVIKPVIDEVGKALEAGVSTVVYGPSAKPPDPKVQEHKKLDEEKRRQWALHVIDWNQKLVNEQTRLRMQKQQIDSQKVQTENQEKQVETIQQQKQNKENPALAARNTTEKRKGVGG